MSKQKNKNFKYKKIITMIVFFVFLFSLITPMLLVPQPAQAGLNATITDLPRIIMDFFQKMYKKTSAFLYNQGLEKYTNKIAYDAAIALSSGKSGQKTDFITNPKEYYKRIGDGAAGDFLNNLATGKMGGVCNVTKGGKPLFRAPSEDEKNNASEDFVFCTKETEATVCPTVGVPRVCKYKPSLCKTDTDCPDYKNWTGISPMEAAMQGLKDPVPMKQYGKNGVEYTVEDECLAGKGKCLVPRIDLCETDLKLRAQIIGGIKGAAFEEVQPECPLSKISKHYKELKSRTKLEDWVDYQSYFNPNANDIGVQLSLMTKMYDKEAGAVIEEEKTIDNGIFSTKSLISKKIKTPAWIKKSWLGKVFTKGADEKKQTGNILADAFGVFAKTYASNFLKILMEKGFSNDDNPDLSDHGATGSTTSIKAAEKIYSSIFTPQIISGGNYDVLSNYLSCPDDLNFAQVDNCVIPQTMGTILQNNEKISFQDAIDAQDKYPWINFPVGKNKNGRILGKGDQDEGFSLANIKKMRLARIVPVGLEIAAQKLVDNTNISSKSLKEIVQGFNGPEGSNFYHLVDPNWILKSPQHQCGAKVFGSILEAPQSTQRGSICVDAKSCLKENADGTCAGAWGYCVREKNIWRFDGDECPERFNNCQTFQKETQAQVSYLKKTLDTVGCDSSNAGCLWYSKAYIEGKELCNKTKIATGDTVFNKCIKDNSLLSAKRIYFNKNVQTCNAKDDGCHEFIQLTDIKNEEYPLIITAQNVFNEVHKVGNTDDNYFNYAKENKIYLNKNRMQCDEANVGCEKYTPTNKEPWIPGIAKTENVCPKECVGYKSYHQLATNFENSVFPVDLIPNGKQCSISEAGCEEFTNLDELAKGGESKEYYTSLRQCVKPESTCGVFYTYFGSDTQGFQIKTYNLQKDGNVPKTTDNIGAEDCNSEEDAMNHPECKQFYDELGNISYKLYKKTISCSDDCHPLRKSGVTSMSECINKGGVWDGNKKQCIYMAIPSEGQTCSAGNMGCRAYRGIQGDNFRIVLQDNFEDKDSKGWVNASITSEAEAISGNSIKSEGTGALANLIKSSVGVMSDSLIQNKSYEISFWAKSGTETKQDVSVNFNNGTSEKIFFGIQSVSMEWNKYSFGPVLFNREVSENEILEIVGNVFVDNISLKEINDIYLIKNSWEVPASCAGENGSGSMLNCAEYQNRNGAFNYLKGFSSLCKEELIGCQALIDTQNSTFPYASVEIKGKTTASDVMAYFVNNPQNYCASQEKGCEALGLPELNASNGVKEDKEGNGIWRDVYLKNDPDFYTTTLCNSNETSCQEYKYGENNASILYFKDPGDKVCEYKLVTGETEYGWYQKGTESGKPNCECELKKISEQSEPKWYQRGTKNEYLNCKKNGDIISGWVGMCPKEQSSCTEFIDPLDNQSFYYLNNNKIDRTSPNGLVSKKEGKILFNDTSKKELIYNATATYELEKENKKAVSPVVCEKGSQSCTANTIIKVDRDRVCGQWLSCKNSTEIFNEGKKKNICDENGLCKKFADDTTSGCDEIIQKEIFLGRVWIIVVIQLLANIQFIP
ncbi:hypothetical protein CVV26_03390 [Candidatus Kuenenbacteria bacterium HGW-Kuenenbacteria-1]|uniref:CBM-cenC domain-containing protein n=1 Tax=Candidatus Kuenenbacteria bacterium HGW-Kuenenbacteria-1 TaxID=2013812 RepID=A0A2N1UMP8_9BACT|nr:MAG: hypothetical protein CVV26_03390 [Candidatus Kuenenbacteria bacterium HGW-Kuenenbacteria-1]